MQRALVLLATLLATGGLATSSCVSERKLIDRFVDEYCAARWACGCESPGLTEVHCVSTLSTEGDELQQQAQDAGLEYDRECARAWLDLVDDACAVQAQPTGYEIGQDECGAPCLPYHGNQPLGAACESIGPWSDCGAGLRCSTAGTCEDPCERQQIGVDCVDVDVVYDCGPSLTCLDGTCSPLPAKGEPCSDRCAPGGMCDGVCVDAPGLGEPCGSNDACGASLRCQDGTCTGGRATVCGVETPW